MPRPVRRRLTTRRGHPLSRTSSVASGVRTSATSIGKKILVFRHLSSYYSAMRRRPGILTDLESDAMRAGIEASKDAGADFEFHGFAIAQAMGDGNRVVAHGSLYKALNRMAQKGWLSSRWEDAEEAMSEGRPRRRLYKVTPSGRAAYAEHCRLSEVADEIRLIRIVGPGR